MLPLPQLLQALVGMPLWACGRSCDLQWFALGSRIHVPARGGGTREVGQYALHVQCAWRLCRADAILVGSADRSAPRDPDAAGEDFDWAAPGTTRCDALVDEVMGRYEDAPLTVVRVSLEPNATLRLYLSEAHVLEVFPDA